MTSGPPQTVWRFGVVLGAGTSWHDNFGYVPSHEEPPCSSCRGADVSNSMSSFLIWLVVFPNDSSSG